MARSRLMGVFALLAGLSFAPSGAATASCAAPTIEVPARIQAGTDVVVRGHQFVDGCDDTGGGTEGAFGCDHEDEPETVEPLEAIELRLRQGSREWSLGTTDAAASSKKLGRAEWTFVLPEDVRPGEASLETDYSQSEPIVIGR
ncbi:hypothetical protein [Aeromicrobium sp. 9AM]|uniref:hypothetical protein n=1 Tax=Aeromicrobium sp. 9AM TaxID=2653126 RepID=UPI0012F0D028|nr:hypothetical protein [Aeromicrobium sp. 9AM]VXB15015.1 conserved exported hypothetical protein [Aeromicrobium sp. 9AM]